MNSDESSESTLYVNGTQVSGPKRPAKPRGDARLHRPQYVGAGLPAVAQSMRPRSYPEARGVVVARAATHAKGNRASRRG